MTGFLWGPLGVLYLLLVPAKHVCPTCGHRTLREPAAKPAGTLTMSRPCEPYLARRVVDRAVERPPQLAPPPANVEELALLQAWVNGDARITIDKSLRATTL